MEGKTELSGALRTRQLRRDTKATAIDLTRKHLRTELNNPGEPLPGILLTTTFDTTALLVYR